MVFVMKITSTILTAMFSHLLQEVYDRSNYLLTGIKGDPKDTKMWGMDTSEGETKGTSRNKKTPFVWRMTNREMDLLSFVANM